MTKTTRRSFLFSAAAFHVGFAAGQSNSNNLGKPISIRPPALGQSWRYAKYDHYTRAQVDTQADRVTALAHSITIESEFERSRLVPVAYPSWGSPWWHEYLGDEMATFSRPREIQQPWGLVVVDPHWSDLQAYKTPVPLWPMELRPGWSTLISTYYMIPNSAETMPWQLDMRAQKWETVTVPAGKFTALRYFNLINFRYTNVSGRVAGQRKETIWFAPEIGRWIARESSGTFYQDVGEQFNESSFRWELLDWS